jgi:hypothetical protein
LFALADLALNSRLALFMGLPIRDKLDCRRHFHFSIRPLRLETAISLSSLVTPLSTGIWWEGGIHSRFAFIIGLEHPCRGNLQSSQH